MEVVMQTKKLPMPPVLFALLAVTTGCGGGGGGIGGVNVGDIDPPVELDDPDPGGIWGNGTITFQEGATDWEQREIGIVSTSAGEMRFVDELGASYVAQVETSKFSFSGTTYQNFSGTVVEFAAPGLQFADGSSVVKGTITGRISEDSIDALIDPDVGGFRNIFALPDDLYARSSSLASVSGTWEDDVGNIYNIDPGGVLFGQDTSGCVYNGSVSIIDADVNVYRINVAISSCADAVGTYIGLGVLDDLVEVADNRALVLNANNGDIAAITLALEKL
jgi:hypothetical protein